MIFQTQDFEAPYTLRRRNLKRSFHFENASIFSVHTSTVRRILKTAAEKLDSTLRVRVNHTIIMTSSFSNENLGFQNVLRPQPNGKPAFSNSSGLKSVDEKLHFQSRLVWTVGLTEKIELRFRISPA